jgi:uncharacterized RDD family membrane protein YckC
MTGEVLDTVVATETPEGIVLELRPAGLSVRFYAFLLDLVFRLVALNILAVPLSLMGGMGVGVLFIFAFLLEWLYPVAFELTRDGATPGKRVFKLKVVMDNGLPITPAASMARNLLRTADFMPFFYGFGIVSMLLRRDAKRLGDIAAGTLVVHEQPAAQRVPMTDVPPLAPAMPLPPRDQAAVIALAARASTLTSERLDELAALAASVSGDQGHRGPQVTRRVLGVAQWLLGHRA